jgi:RNA polymerase sigma factor (sigma-70 family)
MDASRIDGIETRWSLLRLAHATGDPNMVEARRALVLRYAGAVRKYVGRIVINADDADELAQDAVLRLMKGDFAGADPTRGRFRDLLKTAVRNMAKSHLTKADRRKPTGVAPDSLAASDDSRDADWLADWRKVVLDHTWSAYKHQAGSTIGYALLKLRSELPEATSDELAAKLSEATGTTVRADSARQTLRRARLAFAQCLLDEVRTGLDEDTPARIVDELAALELLELVKDLLPADFLSTGVLPASIPED